MDKPFSGIKNFEHYKHETKRKVLSRFLIVIAIVIGYFLFAVYFYGLENGLAVTILSWSFFVFCTPIADAGFVLDFPLRLVTGIKMIFSEIIVWAFAILVNIFFLLFAPQVYLKTPLLVVFEKILLNPFPFWGIILLSALGTFFSIYFGDELMDKVRHSEREKFAKHKKKHKLIIIAAISILVIIVYYVLLSELGLSF